MRPIHAVLLVALLVAILGGALWLVRSDTRSGRIAPPLAGSEQAGESARTAPVLDGAADVDGHDPETGRARVATAAADLGSGVIGLRGRVVDPEGRGVAGATVYASSSDMPLGIALDDVDMGGPFSRRRETKTDKDGRFTLEPEARGAVRLAVRADGFAPYNAQKPIAGTNVDVGDLPLERGVVLMGRVIDESGRGVARAELHLARSAHEGSMVLSMPGQRGAMLGVTDALGNFQIDRLAAGPWSILVTSEEHPDKTESGETDRAGAIVTNIVITLEPGLDIAGHVVGGPPAGFGDLRVGASERHEGEGFFGAFGRQRKSAIAPDGTFRVRGCKRDTNYSLALRRTENGFPSGARSDTVQAQSGDQNVVLTYHAETAITCQVVDKASGQALERFQVSAGYRWPLPLMDEKKGGPRTHFEQGRVRFASVAGGPPTDAAVLRIEAVGYTTFERADLHLVAGTDNDLGLIQLERSALVRVLVVDDARSLPIANALAALDLIEGGDREFDMAFAFGDSSDDEPVHAGPGSAHRGKTDKDGRVQLSSMPGKRVTLSVRHKDHAPWKSGPIDLPAEGDHEVSVRLLSGGTVVVELVDRDKRPVAGLMIDHRNPEMRGGAFMHGLPSNTITDAAGRVVFAHIPAGRHLFRVRPTGGGGLMGGGAGWVSVSGQDGAEAEKGWSEALAREGETVTLLLAAPELGDLHGRVREGGRPLAGATVRLREKRQDPFGLDLPFMGRPLTTSTNASGDYTLAGALVGEYMLVVTHPSRAMKWEAEFHVRTGDARFDVELPLATIEGRITNEQGKPVAGAKVSAQRVKQSDSDENGSRSVEMSVVMISDGGDEGEMISFGGEDAPVVKSDADGRYRLKGVTPNVPLQVVVSGRDYQTTRSDKVELGTDQTRAGLDLVVKQGGSIEVTARRPDGRAVSGAIVRAEIVEGDAAPKTLFTGPEGRVTFQGLVPGRWKITCERTAFEPNAEDAQVPPREVSVVPGRTEKIAFDMPR